MAEPDTKKRPTTFLDLPAELRNRIYEDCLQRYKCTGCRKELHSPKQPHACRFPDDILSYGVTEYRITEYLIWQGTAMPPALTKVNKQIRAETLPMFYAAHSFWERDSYGIGGMSRRFIEWAKILGPKHMKLLRRIQIQWYFKKDKARIPEAKEQLGSLGVDLEKCELDFNE